jgi:hypothetical protein
VIKLRPQSVDGRAQLRHVAQFLFQQLVEHFQARALVPLGPHHVKADNHHAVFVEKLLDQGGDLVPSPGPAAEFGNRQALLVDIEDDDALVHRAGHGEPEPVVIHDIVQLAHEHDLVEMGCLTYESQDDQQPKRDPNDVLLQAFSPVDRDRR